MPGLAQPQASSAAWASMGFQAENALNTGWILDQGVGATGGFTALVTPSSSSTWFFSTGDATAFYLAGRRLQLIQAGVTTYAEVISSSSGPAGSTTSTQVTIGKFQNSTGLSTGAFTSVAASVIFQSTGNAAGNSPNDFGTQYMTTLWGL